MAQIFFVQCKTLNSIVGFLFRFRSVRQGDMVIQAFLPCSKKLISSNPILARRSSHVVSTLAWVSSEGLVPSPSKDVWNR